MGCFIMLVTMDRFLNLQRQKVDELPGAPEKGH